MAAAAVVMVAAVVAVAAAVSGGCSRGAGRLRISTEVWWVPVRVLCGVSSLCKHK